MKPRRALSRPLGYPENHKETCNFKMGCSAQCQIFCIVLRTARELRTMFEIESATSKTPSTFQDTSRHEYGSFQITFRTCVSQIPPPSYRMPSDSFSTVQFDSQPSIVSDSWYIVLFFMVLSPLALHSTNNTCCYFTQRSQSLDG